MGWEKGLKKRLITSDKRGKATKAERERERGN